MAQHDQADGALTRLPVPPAGRCTRSAGAAPSWAARHGTWVGRPLVRSLAGKGALFVVLVRLVRLRSPGWRVPARVPFGTRVEVRHPVDLPEG
jgi:hypothetical protein